MRVRDISGRRRGLSSWSPFLIGRRGGGRLVRVVAAVESTREV